ncbi:S8 family serine peptidase [Nocardioides sp. CFH 31398]|uniref:S8 family serine peptidase n=1 Tax=Nocardioides sp. CFH 31398 TaxID=2919579 RepID=UPI001F05E7C4|nr:S8 family serine peptidase [Nocardioides sp. CFH 31398]MCH1868552.1 S8 family serine peptidase [Nocardioides sp. CFH 31398]
MSPLRRVVALAAAGVVATALSQVVPTTASTGTVALPAAPSPSAADLDRTLGNGLGRLLAQQDAPRAPGYGGDLQVDQDALAIRDDEGRVLLQLGTASDGDTTSLRKAATGLGFVETADDEATGVLEGFAPLSAVEDLAALDDLGTISQVPRPLTFSGDATYQGAALQQADRLNEQGIDGDGITVGVLSDSYDTATLSVDGGPIATRAADDVASGDLPGAGNPEGNTDPVVVLEDNDDPASRDEGRAMLQVIHDSAPGARLCFATGTDGELGFADNIRALADPDGPCGADVIVDDVRYPSSPFFSDDAITRAAERVAVRQGVAYFSAAGDNGGQNTFRTAVDLLSPTQARANARKVGLDLSDVDPALYAGGMQDMDFRRGVDVAQTLQLEPGGGLFNLQWADLVDADGGTPDDPSDTSTDFAALLFAPNGDYLGAIDEDNRATGRPGELARLSRSETRYTAVQLVLARASRGETEVQEIGYVNDGGIRTDEYYIARDPGIYGQAGSDNVITVAAHDGLGPYIPEATTSPGGKMRYYFSPDGDRYRFGDLRRKPDISAIGGGNTTFFGADDVRDADDLPNFGGTSASAAQAAAVGALTMQKAGGPGSLRPGPLERAMEWSGYEHNRFTFSAGETVFSDDLENDVRLGVVGFPGLETSGSDLAIADPDAFRLRYEGEVPLRSVTLLGDTAGPTAPGATPGAPSGGIVFDPRPLGPRGRYDQGGYPFTLGYRYNIDRGDIRTQLLRRVGSTPFHQRLRITFTEPVTEGFLRFGIDRDLRYPGPPSGGNAGDQLGEQSTLAGGGVAPGMTFVALLRNGERLVGRMGTFLGKDYSPVDGFGVTNALSLASRY